MAIIGITKIRTADRGIKKSGDIILVKLEGEPWGTKEIKHFIRFKFEDPELEAKLLEKKKAGEPHPVIVYPYMTYGTGEMAKEITNFSTYRFDWDKFSEIATLFGTTKEILLDDKTDNPILTKKTAVSDSNFTKSDFILDTKSRI